MPQTRTTRLGRSATTFAAAILVTVAATPNPATASRATVHRATATTVASAMRDVLMVGNNWDGTADVIDAATYQRLRRINVIPDRDQRMTEIILDPVRLAAFLFNRTNIGEGHDQFVDDMYASND